MPEDRRAELDPGAMVGPPERVDGVQARFDRVLEVFEDYRRLDR
jgi:hypothetical protein